jgi:glycosyl transferase family 25
MLFQSYIINLPKEKTRHNFMKKQMEKLGLEHTFIPAVMVSHLNEDDYIKGGMGWQRPLRKTELACFLSHREAWKHAANSDTHSLILEDDAVLSPSSKDIIHDVIDSLNFDLLCLETRFRRKKLIGPTQLTTKSKFARLYQDRAGAAAYLLSPAGARKLYNKTKFIKPGLADAYISSSYELQAYQILPALAIQLDQCNIHGLVPEIKTETSINENRPNDQMGLFLKLRFIFRRIIAQVHLAIRIISKMFISKFKEIPIAPDFYN